MLGRRFKVLVVDDEPGWGDLMVDVLDMEGYDVACADDGLQALPLLSTFEPDVVVSDLQMPRMDGRGLLMKVCELDQRLPVVIVTSDRDAADAASVGAAYRVLTKPVPLEELLSVIASAAAQRRVDPVPMLSRFGGMFRKLTQTKLVFATVALVSCAAILSLGLKIKLAA